MWEMKTDKVVFTNGCFDILHTGHVSYLAEAAELGDRLIVALNTDSSVKRHVSLQKNLYSKRQLIYHLTQRPQPNKKRDPYAKYQNIRL